MTYVFLQMIYLLFVVFFSLSRKLWKINKKTIFKIRTQFSVKPFCQSVFLYSYLLWTQFSAIYITFKIKIFFVIETLLSKQIHRLCYRNTVIKTNSQTTLTKQNTAKQQSNVLNSSIHKHLANTVIKKFTDLFLKPNLSNSQTCFLLSKPSPSKNKNSNSCVNCKIHSSLQIHRDWDSVRDPWHRGHGHVCNFTNKLL